jgi:hypothetical protein
LIDAALIIADALRNDAEVSGLLTGGIYAYRIPPTANPPLALIQVPNMYPATSPQTTWWDVMASVDVHCEAPRDSVVISSEVQRVIPTIFGSHPSGVVADSQVESNHSVVDGAWTPTRYRQVVTVTMTAREP